MAEVRISIFLPADARRFPSRRVFEEKMAYIRDVPASEYYAEVGSKRDRVPQILKAQGNLRDAGLLDEEIHRVAGSPASSP